MNKRKIYQCGCGHIFDCGASVKIGKCPECGSSMILRIALYNLDDDYEKELYTKLMGL